VTIEYSRIDGLVKSQEISFFVIPAKLVPDSDPGAGIQSRNSGIQSVTKHLDPVFQRGDDFLRMHQELKIANLLNII